MHAAHEPSVRRHEHFLRRRAAVACAGGPGTQRVEHEAVIAKDHHQCQLERSCQGQTKLLRGPLDSAARPPPPQAE